MLAEFLLARIAEDERAAGVPDPDADDIWSLDDSLPDWPRISPERMRAECDMKRRIVEMHHPRYGECATCGTPGDYDVRWPCPTLRAIALPYSSHPDFEISVRES